jgi:hypothetical protein
VEHIDETKNPHAHASLPAMAAKRKQRAKYAIFYEMGAACTAGWCVFMATGDWKQGVGGALLTMFGGGLNRAGKWYADR